MFNVKKKDVLSKQYNEMKAFNDIHEDEPDGAFFALAEEMFGWDSEDWGWFSEVQEFDKDYN
jgi:hypothetical protein